MVWQKAIDISAEVYKLSAIFPSSEMYGLTNQLRRAANSISLNIAEGHGRNSTKSFTNYLNIARGSLNEVETALLLAVRLDFINNEELKQAFGLIQEESKMLHSLKEKLILK